MNNTRLPEVVTKTYFDCIEQQIMALCLYFHKEFWKLFINQHLVYNQHEVNKVEDVLMYENLLMENAEKYYGISIINVDDKFDLSFQKSDIYLAYIDLECYPLTKDLEREGVHAMLIYGETEGCFIVNDNFCGVTEYLLKKEIYIKGIKWIGKVEYDGKKTVDCLDEFSATFLKPNDKCYEDGCRYILQNDIKEYQPTAFIGLISKISCMVEKDAVMAMSWSDKDRFQERCIQVLEFLANRIRKNYYSRYFVGIGTSSPVEVSRMR